MGVEDELQIDAAAEFDAWLAEHGRAERELFMGLVDLPASSAQ